MGLDPPTPIVDQDTFLFKNYHLSPLYDWIFHIIQKNEAYYQIIPLVIVFQLFNYFSILFLK